MSASRLDYTRASARPTNLSEQDPSYSRAPARAARDYMPSYPRTSTRPATAKDPEAIVHTRESRPKTAPAQATSPQPSATYSPDALAGALIREHLVSRGLRKTLEVFLQEDNEQQDSGLSGRLELAKLLGILKLVRQNRTSEPPEKSYLAIITKHLATRTVITPEDSNYTAKSRPTTATERVSERPRTAARAAPATHLDGPSRSELTPSRSTRISDRRASAREEEYIDPGDTFDYHNPLRTVDSSLVGNSSDDPDQASFAAFAKPLGSFSSSNPRAVAYENGEPGYRVSREQLIGSGDGRAGGGSGAVAGRRANRKSDERQPAYETEVPERSPSRYSQRSSSARASPEAAIDRPPQIERREAPTSRYTSTDRVSPAPYHRITPTNTRKPTPTPPAPTVSFRQPTANELIVTDDFSTASSSEEEDDIQSYKTASQSMTNILSNLHAGPSLGVGRGGTLITTSQALSLRCLVFPGDKGRSTFGEEWKGKGFEFNTAEEVRYGLVQLKVRMEFTKLVPENPFRGFEDTHDNEKP
ncbi:hypothetical protein HK097_000216 [Rhizophlyctis rosea]|uniref:MINDY4 N-terminal dimerisation domain-containing protein n=1 Tax=Rhizophlyctis rosea TaxID=64517 RepID=A0AAD5X2R6_9FUNG|nr:hypothetical protein HK097_000216 [Rhizophlyctis rosea]